MEEVWKDVIGFEGLYQVSNYGRVRSLDRCYIGKNQYGSEFTVVRKGEILKDRAKNKESKYRRIGLRKDGKRYWFFVHRLVAFAFPDICGEYFDGAEVNHKDENPENNCAYNLEWCSKEYNSNYGTRNTRLSKNRIGANNPFYGKHPSDYCKKRSRETNSKPVAKYTKSFVFVEQYESVKDASVKNRIPGPNISNVCNHRGHCKTAGGYIWRFV